MSTNASTRLRRSLERWSAILRYHRPQQLARRAWNRLRDRLPIRESPIDGPTPTVRTRVSREPKASAPWQDARPLNLVPPIIPSPAAGGGLDVGALEANTIRLLNRDFNLGWPPRWDDADRARLPLLAVFHLHYHDWLLKLVGHEPARVWETLTSWLDRFALPDRTSGGWAAWHPYCISRRVFAWLKLLALEPPPSLHAAMIVHLAKQARRLANRFERDIGGNHLWENARALAAFGAVFEGTEADGWRQQGLSTLWLCLRDQLSPEAEHYERSPMYQAELAHGLDELAAVLDGVDQEASQRCRTTAARMTAFLDALCHPDGGLPLLGDTTRDIEESSPNARRAQFIPHPSSFILSHHGDYFIHHSDRGFLLFDAGDVGPDDLPAHSHSDLLGFEASAFGKRLFTDSGVFAYQGPRREEFRKSAAHNVLTVDGAELADVWGSFRVGRRGHVVARQAGVERGIYWIKAEHDAYRQNGVRVQRWWLIAENGAVWISVHVVLGRGARFLVERLHLHPEIDWTQIGRAVTLKAGDGVVRWVPGSAMDVRMETTAYSERFYQERPKTTLVLEQRTELPAVSAWAVALDGGDLSVTATTEGGRLSLRWTQNGVERRFERGVDE